MYNNCNKNEDNKINNGFKEKYVNNNLSKDNEIINKDKNSCLCNNIQDIDITYVPSMDRAMDISFSLHD